MQKQDTLVMRKLLKKQFSSIIDQTYILSTEEELKPYECDGFSAYKHVPLIVVLPGNADEVQALMKACAQLSVPVVARGAGTGLSGGALPHEKGVLLSLARLNKIIDIDPLNACARVQPGVRNLAISEAAKPQGLYYAPDPSSQIACSIGGNVAENAGGVHCLKYGLTVHNIISLEVITAEGDRTTIGGSGFDSPGYDILALMTGSEGMLGIVVEVTVKLLPIPEQAKVALAAFNDVTIAGQAVADIIAEGILPAGLEMMDNPSIRAAEDFAHAGYPIDAAAIILCEVDGGEAEVEEEISRVKQRLKDSGAYEVRVAQDDLERASFWAGRKSAFPAVGRISPDYYCMDGTIPKKHLAYVLGEIARYSEECGLRVANVFHAGDGNMHPLILYNANKEGELEAAEAFGGRILTLCVEMGGSITGEHGVGLEKIDQMCVQFKPEEITLFHAIKNAFDNKGILNPGKAIPTLNRCAEFGAMHISRGEERFPHLERF